MGRKARRIGAFAKKALGWIGKLLGVIDGVPPGTIPIKLHEKIMGVLKKIGGTLESAEQNEGAHTAFWPTLGKAPNNTIIVFEYPDGTIHRHHAMTVRYLKKFKRAFDWLKKIV